jgi:hypothetical protein
MVEIEHYFGSIPVLRRPSPRLCALSWLGDATIFFLSLVLVELDVERIVARFGGRLLSARHGDDGCGQNAIIIF